jgi:hypothetical protein
MDNNAMFAAQQVQYNRMYGGLDAATGRYNSIYFKFLFFRDIQKMSLMG